MAKEQEFIITANGDGEGDESLSNCQKRTAVIRWGPNFVEEVSTLKGEQTAECKIIGNWLGGKKVVLSYGACLNYDCIWNFGYTG